MANGDWTTDRPGRVWAIGPGDTPPVSSLVEAFEGQDVEASDVIVLQGYLGRSDRVQRVREYLQRALRISEVGATTAVTTSLTRTITPPESPGWPLARDEARLAAAEAAARAAGLTAEQASLVRATIAAGPSDATNKQVKRLGEIAKELTDEKFPELADVVGGAAGVIVAQAMEKKVKKVLIEEFKKGEEYEEMVADAGEKEAGKEPEKKAKRLAGTLTTADIAVLGYLLTALQAVRETAEPHLPWRLYLTPRLDRYVEFHQSSLVAWREEPKTERQDACTVWLRAFEQGAQVPIPYRLVSESTLVPSFATWISGQLVDDYGEQAASGGAWGDQTLSGLKHTGATCLRKTGIGCID